MPGVCRKSEKKSVWGQESNPHHRMPPPCAVSVCDPENACHRKNSKKGRTHGWEEEAPSNLAEVMAFETKSSCEMKSWAGDFLERMLVTFIHMNSRDMDRDGDISDWDLHTGFQSDG